MVVNNIYNNLAYLKSLNTRETRGTHFPFDALEKKRHFLILPFLNEILSDIAILRGDIA